MELVFSPNALKRKLSPAFAAVALLLLLLSYSFVIQPSGDPPPAEDLVGSYQIIPENARLILTEADAYELYIDGEYFCSPSDELPKYRVYNILKQFNSPALPHGGEPTILPLRQNGVNYAVM